MNINKSINYLYPNLEFWVDYTVENRWEGDYLIWMTKEYIEPTQSELEQAYNAYIEEESKKAYIWQRLSEYPEIGEQLDIIYKDMINWTSDWTTLITDIKNKYPKPE